MSAKIICLPNAPAEVAAQARRRGRLPKTVTKLDAVRLEHQRRAARIARLEEQISIVSALHATVGMVLEHGRQEIETLRALLGSSAPATKRHAQK